MSESFEVGVGSRSAESVLLATRQIVRVHFINAALLV